MTTCSHCGRDEGYHYPRVVTGVGRVSDNPRAVLLTLNREVTDEDIRRLPLVLRWYDANYTNDCRQEPPR